MDVPDLDMFVICVVIGILVGFFIGNMELFVMMVEHKSNTK